MRDKALRQKYNKEYSAKPEVIAWAKIRNARPERKLVRKAYKKSEQGKESERKYRQNNRDKINARLFRNRLKTRYNLSIEEYEHLVEKHNGRCAICNAEYGKDLHIDHCHKTGKVRGLLCGSCNRGLGLLQDNVDFLSKAIKYLQK